jgi:hypothetical protein
VLAEPDWFIANGGEISNFTSVHVFAASNGVHPRFGAGYLGDDWEKRGYDACKSKIYRRNTEVRKIRNALKEQLDVSIAAAKSYLKTCSKFPVFFLASGDEEIKNMLNLIFDPNSELSDIYHNEYDCQNDEVRSGNLIHWYEAVYSDFIWGYSI